MQTYLEATKTKFTKKYKAMNPSRITTTVGLNIGKIDVDGVRLNFWDLGGQQELQSLWDKVWFYMLLLILLRYTLYYYLNIYGNNFSIMPNVMVLFILLTHQTEKEYQSLKKHLVSLSPQLQKKLYIYMLAHVCRRTRDEMLCQLADPTEFICDILVFFRMTQFSRILYKLFSLKQYLHSYEFFKIKIN